MAVEITSFGSLPDGREAKLYTLKNQNGLTLAVTDYGCRIVRLLAKDRDGNFADVVLGHRTLAEYFGANYQGAFVGRYANRIGGAKFSLAGKVYELSKNDGKNTLHGGPGGCHQMLFSGDAEDGDEPCVVFTATSPDGEEGYPGTLKISVSYTLTGQDELDIRYCAVSDQETIFNPTNHAFFNLSGDPQKEVLDTVLKINASKVTRVGPDLIPDGTYLPVQGTPLDFNEAKPIGRDMAGDDPIVQQVGGYDHNFCVDGEGFRLFAEAYEPGSGRVMEVSSDLPGVQLYTFNSVDGLVGKDGQPMRPHTAFCLETQFYPDSPNHDSFPFRTLKPEVPFVTETVYRFSTR